MKLNILFLPSDKGGVYQYRVEAISKWLTKLDLARTRILYQENFGILDLLWADLIVCQRKYDKEEFDGVVTQSFAHLKQMNDNNPAPLIKKFVFDTDDLLEKVAKTNPAYRLYHPGSPHLARYRDWIAASHALTTSTQRLSKEYADINPNAYVCPNFIDPELWETLIDFIPPPDNEGKVRIGFAGSNTHYDDVAMIKPDLKAIMQSHPNVELTIFGVPPLKDGEPLPLIDLRTLLNDLPQDRVTFVEGVETRNYPTRLKSLGIDIGICPLVDNVFNQSKSAIKFYEYSMAGAAVIASDVGEYPEVITKETGLLCKRNDWYKSMRRLVLDAELRKGLASRAHTEVVENYSAEAVAPIWYHNYLDIWHKKVVPNV